MMSTRDVMRVYETEFVVGTLLLYLNHMIGLSAYRT